MGEWLHGGMETLGSYFGVERFHVVAHSQGGLPGQPVVDPGADSNVIETVQKILIESE